MNADKARASKCSSCPIKEDFSNYWTPKLYYQYENGTFQSVPTVGDNMGDQNGGMTVYYLQRGPAADTKTLKAFPEGFRMLAGDTAKRSYGGDFKSDAINFNCLGANKPETNGLPNYNCPGGLRAQVFFPSCWDGKNLDSDDHMAHMSYPSSGAYNGGGCPSTHPVQLISLFFEVLYDTTQFKNMWYGDSHPFVFSNGDPTGYGFHGDFVNGWNVPTLQKVVDECDNLADQGVIEKCGAITIFTNAEQATCRIPAKIDEKLAGFLPALPGCNPVSAGPDAAAPPTCTDQKVATIGSGPKYYTDVTSKGWGYIGCGVDGDPRTLNDKTSIYGAGVADTMTVEVCADFCKGYKYFGLEFGQECWCGNTLSADRAPQDGIFGGCTMKCKGDADEYCGGGKALSLYMSCSGSDCVNVGASSDAPAPAAPLASSVAAVASSSELAVSSSPIKVATSSTPSSEIAPVIKSTSTSIATIATNGGIYDDTTTTSVVDTNTSVAVPIVKAASTPAVDAASVVTVTAPAVTVTVAAVTVTKTKTKNCSAYKA
jgi:hypothetical protein